MLNSSPNLLGFPSLPSSCVGSSNTGGVNNWFYCLSPGVSHFHQPAGEYVLAASNWVQLRVCDSSICEALCGTKSLNYEHSYNAFLLEGSSESCVPVQIQLYACSEIFPSFCFHKKLVWIPASPDGSGSAATSYYTSCIIIIHTQFSTRLRLFQRWQTGCLVPVNIGIWKIPECQNW